MKKGDAVALVMQPGAKTIDFFLGTNLQNCAGCKRMTSNLNAGMSFTDAIYDRFFAPTNKENHANKSRRKNRIRRSKIDRD